MNAWSEGKAAAAALLVSSAALGLTFSFAAVMRRAQGPAPSAAAMPASPPAAAGLTLGADVTQGRHLFLMNCAHCHGDDARGDEGPDLHDLHKSDARIHLVITAGIKGEMPSFGKKFQAEEIRALTSYLRSLKT